MDDFFRPRKDPRNDSFFDDGFFPSYGRPPFESPISMIHNSMAQIHREMDDMMRFAFGRSAYPEITPPNSQPNDPSNAPEPGKQLQPYGSNSFFNDADYLSEWDFVKQLEQLDKRPDALRPSINSPNMQYYGRSHFYNYSSTGDGKVEERKVIQDSQGNRMESIQKKLGDRIWAKTIKRNEKGEVDEDEKMYNMSDEDKEKFISEWRSANRSLFGRGIPNPPQDNVKSIDILPDEINERPTNEPITLPSLEHKGSSWMDKLKFWK